MAKTFAGLNELNRLEETLPQMSRRQRSAFSAVCAERVILLVENYFGHATDCLKAIDLTWRFALGENISTSEVERVAQDCDSLVEKLYKDDETGSILGAVNVACYALETTRDPEPEPALRAAVNARSAARIDDRKHGDEYLQEEAEWQILALEVALNTLQPTRDMFRRLPSNPNWSQVYLRNPQPDRS